MKLLGSSLVTASLLVGSIFTEVSIAGSARRKLFHFHHPHSVSCRASHHRRNYTVTITNHKNHLQTYWFDGTEYQLLPGHQHTFSKQIGRTHRCRTGNMALPLIEFDRIDHDGRFTSKKVRLNSKINDYYFDASSRIVHLKRG